MIHAFWSRAWVPGCMCWKGRCCVASLDSLWERPREAMAKEMLDGGIRFIDFRISYTQGPDRVIGCKDWYCLHGCESQKKAIEYLKEVRQWLLAWMLWWTACWIPMFHTPLHQDNLIMWVAQLGPKHGLWLNADAARHDDLVCVAHMLGVS